jgi:hypothetical protein
MSKQSNKPNKARLGNPTSRPVLNVTCNMNLNPAFNARPRFHEKGCQPAIEIHFAIFP